MESIQRHFPNLTAQQTEKLQQLGALYQEWNEKINVISRKDIDNVYPHHILHSMTIAKYIDFKPEAKILDLGTGGGLPGIPLAILFPETNFTLIDGTRKKIMVVNAICEALNLSNAKGMHIRAEEHKSKYDFVVSRAVARTEKLAGWAFPLIRNKQIHAIPNGLITLKGGSLQEELKELPKGSYYEQYPLTDFINESYFDEKSLVYVQA